MKSLLAHFARQSPAMVVAMLALFVALGGTAVATTSALITGKQIKNASITGVDIKDKSLTSRDIRGQLRGPRGLPGAPGSPGPQGPAGPQGPSGPTPDCPAGTRVALGACFEEAPRSALTFSLAAESCAAANRRLPTASELRGFRLQPGITLANPEISSTLFYEATLLYYIAVNDVGAYTVWETADSNYYRCVASRVG